MSQKIYADFQFQSNPPFGLLQQFYVTKDTSGASMSAESSIRFTAILCHKNTSGASMSVKSSHKVYNNFISHKIPQLNVKKIFVKLKCQPISPIRLTTISGKIYMWSFNASQILSLVLQQIYATGRYF